MKPVKLGLRIWIAITSILSFLGGWALFSHAGKPAPLFPSSSASSAAALSQQPAPMPTLPPVPSIDQLVNGSASNSGLQQLPSISSMPSQSFLPRMRTMGS